MMQRVAIAGPISPPQKCTQQARYQQLAYIQPTGVGGCCTHVPRHYPHDTEF